MKKKIFTVLLALVLLLSFSAAPAAAMEGGPNTILSSTMVFEGTLIPNGDGTYSGTIPCVNGIRETALSLGDGEDGFDQYARDGAIAAFSNSAWNTPGETFVTIAEHDAFPDWPTDTPDAYDYYALTLDGNSWKLVYNETTLRNWKIQGGVPMSGLMDWHTMYASETDFGSSFGYGETGDEQPDVEAAPGDDNYGWAALHGAGPACWDIDWIEGANGSEVVPLQFPGFAVVITETEIEGVYAVTLTPAAPPAVVGMAASSPGELIGISVDRTFVDFGSLNPGQVSDPEKVTVTNEGNVTVALSASLANISSPDVYTTGLKIDTDSSADTWGAANIAPNGTADPSLVLTMPTGAAPGIYAATLVFWAEAK